MPRRRRRSKVRDRLTDGVNLLCACGKSLATYHVTVNGDPDGWPATRARWNRADFPADIRHADKWQVKCPLCGRDHRGSDADLVKLINGASAIGAKDAFLARR